MNLPERNFRYQPTPPPPTHRRKTPSFSSSLLDSILRSIDETNEIGGLHNKNLHHQPHDHDHDNNHDRDLMFFPSEPKPISKIRTHSINGEEEEEEEQIPSLRRAIMIDQWMETHNNNNINYNSNRDGYVSRKSSRKFFSSDSSNSSTGTTTFSSETETPSTHRSLPNSFTISRKTAEAVFLDDTQNQKPTTSVKREAKFMKSTKLRAMKIYGDLKKGKQQPISPGSSRISAFLYSLFAFSSSSKKPNKIDETIRSLKKSRSINKHDNTTTTTCSSFSRSCMSKKQHNNNNKSGGVKRSVRFYPDNETVILGRKSIDVHRTKYDHQRQWFTEKSYVNKYKNFVVEDEDDDEDEEDDLFELEIVGGVGTCAYGEELPVFETTDLRRIRI